MRAAADEEARKRRILVLLCSLCTGLSYCDRVNMAVAVTDMAKELGWDLEQRSAVLAGFFNGYVLSQIPGSYAATRFGPHLVLGVSAFLWTLATIAVPFLASISHKYVVYGRAFLGICEGSVFPVIYDLFGKRIPRSERSRALGSIQKGVFAGAIFSFIASPVLMHNFHWNMVFYFFGGLGMIWVALWFAFTVFVDELEVEKVELKTSHLDIPKSSFLGDVRHIMRHRAVFAIIFCHFCHNIAAFVLMSWLPTYFEDAFGFGGKSLALSCLPYLAMAVAVQFTSVRADELVSGGQVKLAEIRRISTVTGFCGAGVFMLGISLTSEPTIAILCMCCALACNGSGPVAGYEAAKLDIASSKYVGRLQSISNTIAAFAGIIGVPMVALIKTSTGSWNGVFIVMSMVFFSAALVFQTFGRYSERLIE